MTSATRMMHERVVSRSSAITIAVTRVQMTVAALTIVALASALSLVYMTNMSRSLHAAIQQGIAERSQLKLEWGQLLLERGTWVMQARIQHIAEDKLGMAVPDAKSIMIVSEK